MFQLDREGGDVKNIKSGVQVTNVSEPAKEGELKGKERIL